MLYSYTGCCCCALLQCPIVFWYFFTSSWQKATVLLQSKSQCCLLIMGDEDWGKTRPSSPAVQVQLRWAEHRVIAGWFLLFGGCICPKMIQNRGWQQYQCSALSIECMLLHNREDDGLVLKKFSSTHPTWLQKNFCPAQSTLCSAHVPQVQ